MAEASSCCQIPQRAVRDSCCTSDTLMSTQELRDVEWRTASGLCVGTVRECNVYKDHLEPAAGTHYASRKKITEIKTVCV